MEQARAQQSLRRLERSEQYFYKYTKYKYSNRNTNLQESKKAGVRSSPIQRNDESCAGEKLDVNTSCFIGGEILLIW